MKPVPPEEAAFQGRDAYSSAALLAGLVLTVGLVHAAAQGGAPERALSLFRALEMGVAAVALGYLGLTRKRPKPQVAYVYCAAVILPLLVYFPLSAVLWHQAHRPVEALVGPHVALVSVALVVPRSLKLGIATVAAFLFEAIGIFFYLVMVGTPRALLPAGEPLLTVIGAVLGMALVVLRRQRHEWTLRHLRSEAELLTLQNLSTEFRTVAHSFDDRLRTLSTAILQLRERYEGERALLESAQKALVRLFTVSGQLQNLVETVPEGAPLAPAQVSDSERLLHARDAQGAALLLSGVMAAASGLALIATRSYALQGARALWALLLVAGGGSLGYLWRTRTRPSQIRGLVIFLVLALPLFGIMPYNQVQLAKLGVAFVPLMGAKAFMVFMPLVIPRYLGLGLALEAAMAVESIAVYRYLLIQFPQLRDRTPHVEPWMTLVICVVGVTLLFTREHRRLASVRLLRAEMQRSTLQRQARLVLSVLDQVGSPLQVLTTCLDLFRLRHPEEALITTLREEVQQLVEARQQVPQKYPHSTGPMDASIGAAVELARRHPA